MVKRGEMPLSKFKDRERKRRAVRLENKVRSIIDEVKHLYPNGYLPNCRDGRFRLER